MELQQFPSWWEKLLYCPRYEVKGSQTIRGQQRARDQGTRFQMSVYHGTFTAILLGTIKGLFVFTTATRCKRFLDRDINGLRQVDWKHFEFMIF